MLPIITKKVILPRSVLGFAILQAAQFAVKKDTIAEFHSQLFEDGYIARKVFQRKGMDFKVEAAGDKLTDNPIDTRIQYHDFIVSCFDDCIGGTREAIQKRHRAIDLEADDFINDILQMIEIRAWVNPPKLERETCGWCPGKVDLKWRRIESEWECPNHGVISTDFIVMEMIRPFLH